MKRRTFLASGGLALAGYAVGGCATSSSSRGGGRRRRGARRSISRRSERLVRSRHSHHRRPSAASRLRLRPPRGEARRQDADPQLRARRRRHVARLGLRRDGRRVRAGDRPAPRGRRRLRLARPDDGAAAAAARLRRHDLRGDRAAGHDVEHVAGRLHADDGAGQQRPAHARLGRAVPARGGDLVRAAAADGRPGTTASTGWTTTTPPTIPPRPARGGGRGGEEATARPTRTCCRRCFARTATARCSARASIRSPTQYAIRTPALAIEPSIYLDALVRDFLMFGGRIVIRKFDTPRDLMSLTEPIVVNCTGPRVVHAVRRQGAGADQGTADRARRAAGGDTIAPAGARASGGNASMNSRSDGIIVGNLQDRGNWSLEPDQDVLQRNVQAAIDFFSRMRPPAPGARLTRSGPPRNAPTVDSFFDAQS